MLLFKEFYDTKSIINNVRKQSLGYTRRSMPQIFGDDIKKFLKFLDSEKIKYEHGRSLPSELKPSQKEFDENKVLKMLENPSKFLNSVKPIIISSDGYVIDGHHRWLMGLIYNETKNTNIDIFYIRIKQKAKPLIDTIKKFDHVAFKKVNESICVTTEPKQT